MFLSAVILAIISSYEFFMITVFTISAACSHTSIQFSMQAYMFFHTTTVLRSLSPYSLCMFSTYNLSPLVLYGLNDLYYRSRCKCKSHYLQHISRSKTYDTEQTVKSRYEQDRSQKCHSG